MINIQLFVVWYEELSEKGMYYFTNMIFYNIITSIFQQKSVNRVFLLQYNFLSFWLLREDRNGRQKIFKQNLFPQNCTSLD